MPQLEWWQWALGAFCAFGFGMAKTATPGIGTLLVPLMVLVVGDARRAAAWIVPILSVADIFAVAHWRRHAETKMLFGLIPWVAVGMVGGAAALALDEPTLRRMVGVIVLLMVVLYLWRKRGGSGKGGNPKFYGVFAGFASTVANSAGPVMSLYLLTKNLPKAQFVATGAWFFLVVNFLKWPIYAGYGLFSWQSVVFDLMMIPATVAGSFSGLWIVRHIPQWLFETLVIGLTAVAAFLLFR